MPINNNARGLHSGTKKIRKSKNTKNLGKKNKKKENDDYIEESDEEETNNFTDVRKSQQCQFKRSSSGQKYIPQLNTLFIKYLLMKFLNQGDLDNLDLAREKDNIKSLLQRCKQNFNQHEIYLNYIEENLIKNENSQITKAEHFYKSYDPQPEDEADRKGVKEFLKREFSYFMNSKYYVKFICDVYKGNNLSKFWLIRNKYPLFCKLFEKKIMSYYPVSIPKDKATQKEKDDQIKEFLKKLKNSIIDLYETEGANEIIGKN